MVEEIKESLYNNVKDKMNSPFWGVFITSWIIWNWRVWYVSFFVDSELLMNTKNILKIDYISNLYHWDSFGSSILSISLILILPLFSTYVVIFWITKITRKFHVKYADYDYDNKLYILKKEEQLLAARHSKLKTEEKVLEKEDEVEKIKIKTQEEFWDKEFLDFKKTRFFGNFPIIRESIYSHGGYTSWNNYSIPSEVLAFFDANRIIEGASGGGDRIRITTKGKYFIKKSMEEKK